MAPFRRSSSCFRNTAVRAVLLLVLVLQEVVIAHDRNRCYTNDLPIVLLKRSSDGRDYEFVKRIPGRDIDLSDDDMEGGFRKRKLLKSSDYLQDEKRNSHLRAAGGVGLLSSRELHDNHGGEDNEDILSSNTTFSFQDGDEDDEGDLYYARECTCFDYDIFPDSTLYCPFVVDTCREVINNHFFNESDYIREVLRCENEYTVFEEARMGVMISIMVGYAIMLVLLVSTHKGKSALSLVPAILTCGRWNEWQATRLLHGDNREHALRMIWTNFRVRREAFERQAYRDFRRLRQQNNVNTENNNAGETTTGGNNNEESAQESPTPAPTSLALRTRIYKKKHDVTAKETTTLDNYDDDNDENECIICMTALLDGDRVGLLKCDHVFHVECLKPWLQRCNACPLCKKEEVAAPQFEMTDLAATDNETDSQSPSTANNDTATAATNTNEPQAGS